MNVDAILMVLSTFFQFFFNLGGIMLLRPGIGGADVGGGLDGCDAAAAFGAILLFFAKQMKTGPNTQK